MALWYDKKAYALLKKCSDAKDLTEWNAYRKKTNHAPINLRFADLIGFYLVDADLRDIDFRGTFLAHTKCHGADVNHVNISTNFYWYAFFVSVILTTLLSLSLYTLGIKSEMQSLIFVFVSFVFLVSLFYFGSFGMAIDFGAVGILGILVGFSFADNGVHALSDSIDLTGIVAVGVAGGLGVWHLINGTL